MLRRSTFALILALACAGAANADPASTLVQAARSQIGVTVIYDATYRRLDYPGGDLPLERGVCTDVVIRAFRVLGVDLQRLVHEDMRRAWNAYPRLWELAGPDSNIDHRRVPNLVTFFRRQGWELVSSDEPSAFRAGDLVAFRLASGLPHIGIVSDRTEQGRPLVLHNVGAGAREEDVLFTYQRTGHFRYRPEAAVRAAAPAAQ